MEGLQHVHRDIKAENIFLYTDPDHSLHIAVGDLDFACAITSEEFAGRPFGTQLYMPPEMLSQCYASDVPPAYRGTPLKGDIWAAALVMRELCSFSKWMPPKTYGAVEAIMNRGAFPLDPVVGDTSFHWLIRLLLTVDAEKRPTATEARSLIQELDSPNFLKLLSDHALRHQNTAFIKCLLGKKPESLAYFNPEQLYTFLRNKVIPDNQLWNVYQNVSFMMTFDEFYDLIPPTAMQGILASLITQKDLALLQSFLDKRSNDPNGKFVFAGEIQYAQKLAQKKCPEALKLLQSFLPQ